MKKILLIFGLFLFLEAHSFLTASRMLVVANDPVCPDGYLQEKLTWDHCPQLVGTCCSKSSTGLFCDRTSTSCNILANDFCDCFQGTLKNTKPILFGISDPVCPSGFVNLSGVGDYIRQKCNLSPLTCCKGAGVPYQGQCAYNDGSPVALFNVNFRSCDQIKFANKICTDQTTKLNTSGKCEQYVETKWALIQNCGNKTVVNSLDHYDGVSTAIGCVPVENLTDFLTFILKWAFFASGGIILLLIISTGYTIITSSGNPEKLQGAQENIVALFSGLALIAFSLVLLQAIGADILNLTAFKGP